MLSNSYALKRYETFEKSFRLQNYKIADPPKKTASLADKNGSNPTWTNPDFYY